MRYARVSAFATMLLTPVHSLDRSDATLSRVRKSSGLTLARHGESGARARLAFRIANERSPIRCDLPLAARSHALPFTRASCSVDFLEINRRTTCPFHIHNPVRTI